MMEAASISETSVNFYQTTLRQKTAIFKVHRIFGSVTKKATGTGEIAKLHDQEFHDLYFSPDVARIIKSMRIRWAGM
jgi:hypothetical protein